MCPTRGSLYKEITEDSFELMMPDKFIICKYPRIAQVINTNIDALKYIILDN